MISNLEAATPMKSSERRIPELGRMSVAEPVALEPKLTVRGLSAWYGKNRALHDVNLTVAPRSVMAAIGP